MYAEAGKGGSHVAAQQQNTAEVDPAGGSAKGIEAYQMNRMNKMHLDIMHQELRSKTYDADIKRTIRDFGLQEAELYGWDKDGNQTRVPLGYSNIEFGELQKLQTGNAQMEISRLAADLGKWDARFYKEASEAEIAKKIAESKYWQAIAENVENEKEAMNAVVEALKDSDGNMNAVKGIIYMLLKGASKIKD